MLSEDLAPYIHDDTDLAIRLASAGYDNGIFGLRFYSDVKWGGTRINPHPELPKIQLRNMNKLRERHSPELERIARSVQRKAVIPFPEICSDELDREAMLHYEKTRRLAAQASPSVARRIGTGLRRILAELRGKG